MDGLAGALRSFLGGGASRRPDAGPKADNDFWISDSMATVCYDCDVPFSLLVRRHHCRHCGRLFCSKCTAHSLPATSGAPGGDPVRVCNFCFQRSRAGGVAAAEEPREGEDSEKDEAAPLPPLGPAAQLLRRGTLTASAALAAFVEPLHGAWAGGALASTRPGDGNDAGEGAHQAQSEEGVRALASFRTGAEEEESDSDSEGLTTQGPLSTALRSAALASLLEDLGSNGEEAQDGSLSGASAAAAARTGAAAAEADLLPASSESTDVGDAHPLSAREDAGDEAGDAREAASAAAADASFSSWLADLHSRDAASQELPVPDPAPPAGWCSGEALFEGGEEAGSGVWSPPHQPVLDGGDTTAAAACRAALHEAGAAHLRAVVRQALVAGGVPHAEEWVPILSDLAAAAAAAIQPSSAGGAGYSMDPRDYVCVKRIPGGQRGDSRLVRGVACRRSVAHKRMATTVEAPRLLLLGGALQYQRVEGRLSSLDTLLEQERAHLRVACARAVALQPSVVLVEKSCARYAQVRRPHKRRLG
jgi:1-phosphatidylinositol-3-phosphate 5-kinase